jgi:hypothetical protein
MADWQITVLFALLAGITAFLWHICNLIQEIRREMRK